ARTWTHLRAGSGMTQDGFFAIRVALTPTAGTPVVPVEPSGIHGGIVAHLDSMPVAWRLSPHLTSTGILHSSPVNGVSCIDSRDILREVKDTVSQPEMQPCRQRRSGIRVRRNSSGKCFR